MTTTSLICHCGRKFFPTPTRTDKCYICALAENNPGKPVSICERCDHPTLSPLVLKDGEWQCQRCLTRPPDPTIEEIYRMANQIRDGRNPDWEMD